VWLKLTWLEVEIQHSDPIPDLRHLVGHLSELGLNCHDTRFLEWARCKQRGYELEHCRQGDQDELRIEMTRILHGRGYQT
jgi:hypothetical protein